MVGPVRIEITSTLTQEDESRMASAVLAALSGLLDILPIAYLIRVQTGDERVVEHVSVNTGHWNPVSQPAADSVRNALES